MQQAILLLMVALNLLNTVKTANVSPDFRAKAQVIAQQAIDFASLIISQNTPVESQLSTVPQDYCTLTASPLYSYNGRWDFKLFWESNVDGGYINNFKAVGKTGMMHDLTSNKFTGKFGNATCTVKIPPPPEDVYPIIP